MFLKNTKKKSEGRNGWPCQEALRPDGLEDDPVVDEVDAGLGHVLGAGRHQRLRGGRRE